jgi:ATP-dependent helicase/nuclease subunit B
MVEVKRLQLFTIPAHRAFADTLVAGLMKRTGGDAMALARGLILLPNNRAARAVSAAFVRASGSGLLLPRLVTLGSPDLGEAVGAALDPVDDADPPPPAIAPMQRRMILARLVFEERAAAGAPVDAAEAVRLAGELCHTLDQLLVEEVAPEALRDLDLAPELTDHWQRALSTFRIVLERWPGELARLGRIDAATRRRMLLDRLVTRWQTRPPAGFVCAAGVTDPAPAVARLLRCVAEAPQGLTVFAGLDLQMPEAEWDALGPHAPDPVTGRIRRSIETHPQFHLKLILDRMGVGRGEVAHWPGSAGPDAGALRGRAIANASGAGRLHRQMDRAEGRGSAPDRGRRRGTRDAGGRGAGDRAGAARCDRGTGQDCRAGDAGSCARSPGQRAFAAVADRGERHGGPTAVDPAAGHAAARARRGGGAAVRAAGAAGAAQASAGQGRPQ